MLTDAIIKWGGIVFPLLAFVGTVAWKYPAAYNKYVGPAYLSLVVIAFVGLFSYNIGSITAESAIKDLEKTVVPPPEDYYPSIKASEEEIKEWQRQKDQNIGGERVIDAAQDLIDSKQFGLWEFYWFLGFLYYGIFLGGVKDHLDKLEKSALGIEKDQPENPKNEESEKEVPADKNASDGDSV